MVELNLIQNRKYGKSVLENQEDIEENDLIKELLKYLRKEGAEFIKEIPFNEIWDAFWYVQKAHVFVEESHKAAVIYTFNEETR
jgi:hypothetical protein